MATLAFFQNRLGRTDGVSLEVDKWRSVLTERMGHQVRYCSGNDDVPTNDHLPELYAQHPRTWKILRNGTVAMTDDYAREEDLELEIYNHADVIEAKLLQFLTEKKVDVLIPNNLCSGGYQPASAIAFHRVIRRTGKPAIIHSHDFYFEDSGEVQATCQTVASIYERYFPSKLPNVQHVMINQIARQQLKQRKNIDARVVPNVFDFRQPAWQKDEFNARFRDDFGIGADDLIILQATRILDRKGIELAIDLVSRLGEPARRKALNGMPTAAGGRIHEKSRLVLLCAGIIETIGISGNYWGALQDHARELGVELLHIGDRIAHSRGPSTQEPRTYSLWDSYVFADLVTYPSLWEGWGNQFIEAVFAKLPVVVFEYPVWQSDLGPAGFDVISLGGSVAGRNKHGLACIEESVLATAADQTVAVLTNPERRRSMVEKNFQIGSEKFSLETLHGILTELLGNIGL